MTRLQIIQYTGAIATLIAIILQDPEVANFLMEHPWTTGGLLSAPSFTTLAALAARAVARHRAPAVEQKPESDEAGA